MKSYYFIFYTFLEFKDKKGKKESLIKGLKKPKNIIIRELGNIVIDKIKGGKDNKRKIWKLIFIEIGIFILLIFL